MKKTLLLGAFFFALLSLPFLSAKERSIFEKHKQKIVQTDSVSIDGYVFARGDVAIAGDRKEIAFSKAKVLALGKLTYYLRERVDWPESISPAFRKKLWEEYQKLITTKLSVHSLVTVFQNSDGKTATVIVAIQEEILDQKPITWNELRAMLVHIPNCRSGKIQVALSLEICTEEEYPAVLNVYAEKLKKDYGPNIARMILEKNVESYQVNVIGEQNFDTLPAAEIVKTLEQCPYDPELCYWAGVKLAGEGLERTAQIFWRCGSRAAVYSPDYAKRCLRRVKKTTGLAPLPVLPEYIYAPICGKPHLEHPNLIFLIECPGMLPVGTDKKPQSRNYEFGLKAWKNGRLDVAYDSFVRAAVEEMTFDACNMAGYAGRLLGRNMEAAAFLLQAVVLKPDSVYPWIHLAWIYRSMNLKKQEEYCIARVKAAKQLDGWTQGELQKLTAK